METSDRDGFIQHLADIFGQSNVLTWEATLQKVLVLLRDVTQAGQAAVFLLDERQPLLTCVAFDQNTSQILCNRLKTSSAFSQAISAGEGILEFTLPALDTPVLALPVPPKGSDHVAVFVFADVNGAPPRDLLEQCGALLTPLVQNTRSYWEEYYRVLARASSALAQTLDQDQALDQVLEQVTQITAYDAGNVMLIVGESAQVVRYQGYKQFRAEKVIRAARFSLETPLLREMLNQRRPIMIPDTTKSTAWVTLPDLAWIRSNLSVPIVSKDEVIGCINLHSKTPDFFTEQHVQRLQILADYVAIAIQNARVYQNAQKQAEDIATLIGELQRRQALLEGLNTVITTMNSALNLDDILNTGLTQAIQIADMKRGAICLLDATDERFGLRVHQGFEPDELEEVMICRLGLGITGRILGQASSIPIGKQADLLPLTPDGEGMTRDHISLPLVVGNQIVGVMNLDAPEQHAIPIETQQLLGAIADQLALAVQRGELTAQMREQLQTVHNLYATSAAFLSQMNMRGIIFILLRTLTDVVEGTLSTAFYQLKDGAWTRERVYNLQNTPDLVKQKWTEGPAWEVELGFLDACLHERMLVLASRRRGRIPAAWSDIETLGAGQLLYFPLFLPNYDFFGVVNVMLADDRVLAAHESTLTWTMVQQGSAALVRVKLYEESRGNETRLRAILESSRDGIFLIGHDTIIHYVNGQALRQLNLSGDTTTWEEQPLSAVVAATRDEAPQLAGWLTQITRRVDGHDLAFSEEDMVFETAHGLFIKLIYTPVYSEHPPSPGSLVLLRDITEQRALERMRDDLLNMLVHDMRNPLSVIQNAIQLLQDPNMLELNAEVIGIAMMNTEKLLELVNTILEIGRLEAGRIKLDQEAVYLPDYAYKVVRDIAVSTDHLELKVSIPADLPLLWVDIAIIERVLQNLLSNAIKFVPEEQGLIQIMSAEDVDWVTLEIYNNGPHIPPDIYKRLFQKYTAGNYEAKGYGLGLAFCKLAVEAHGGQIWARNQPEGGVSFYFTLPVFHVPDFPDEEA